MFLYMGMGVFTGRFRDWDWRFIGLAIVFCLVARLFNTFPFSALANLWCVLALLACIRRVDVERLWEFFCCRELSGKVVRRVESFRGIDWHSESDMLTL